MLRRFPLATAVLVALPPITAAALPAAAQATVPVRDPMYPTTPRERVPTTPTSEPAPDAAPDPAPDAPVQDSAAPAPAEQPLPFVPVPTPTPTSPTSPPAPGASLTLTADRKAGTVGQQVTLRGVALTGGQPVPGAWVTVTRSGQAAQSVRTDAKGVFQLRVRPSRTTVFRARMTQDPAVVSARLRVAVTANLAVTVARAGRTLRISGRARGLADRRLVTVQIRKIAPGFAYQNVARVKVRHGRFVLRRPVIMPAGRFAVRVRSAAGQGLAAGTSRPLTITVR